MDDDDTVSNSSVDLKTKKHANHAAQLQLKVEVRTCLEIPPKFS
jgi:hypothetical protein